MSIPLPARESADSDSVAAPTMEPQAVLPYADPPSASSIAVIGVRLLALFMLGLGLISVSELVIGIISLFFTRVYGSDRYLGLILALFPAGVWLALSRYCWVRADSIGRRITPVIIDASVSQSSLQDQLLSVVLMGVGVYLIGEGAPGFGRSLYMISMELRSGNSTTTWISYGIGEAVRIAFGGWLVLGNHGVIMLIRRHSARWREKTQSAEVSEPD